MTAQVETRYGEGDLTRTWQDNHHYLMRFTVVDPATGEAVTA